MMALGPLAAVIELLIFAALLLWGFGAGETASSEMVEPFVPPPYPTPSPAAAPAPAFVDGLHTVGPSGIAPGTYRSSAQQGECYWARLSDFSAAGEVAADAVIASDRIREHDAVATILPRDAGFVSRGCSPWLAVTLPDVDSSYTTYTAKVGDGLHIVGDDIVPGAYRPANPQDSCRWARLASFARPDDLIASGTAAADATVTIAVTDAGFASSGCGEWHSLGFNNCAEMRAVFPHHTEGVYRRHPVYSPKLDADNDGQACETEN